jgi:uncharacterized protein (DUF924 family)
VSQPRADDPEGLLEFWFADAAFSPGRASARNDIWFGSSPVLDRECRARYGALLETAARGELDAWQAKPRSALALVVLLDQIPRNVFRGSARMFAYDGHALARAVAACVAGFATQLHPIEAAFLYLPFEHAEDLAMQDRGVEGLQALAARAEPGFYEILSGFLDYARRHREVIRRFGRFPHRNAVLGRAPTRDEQAYLRGGGETFGA